MCLERALIHLLIHLFLFFVQPGAYEIGMKCEHDAAVTEKFSSDEIIAWTEHHEMEIEHETASSTTTIAELNDDCLREVFEHLHARELHVIADVCTRFREIAREYVKFMDLNAEDIPLKRIPSILRNLGAGLVEISIGFDEYPKEYHVQIIELLVRYCNPKSEQLAFWSLDITHSIAFKMQALLRHLCKLEFYKCAFSEHFMKMLPKWSPNMKELIVADFEDHDLSSKGFFQNFPKLEKIELINGSNVQNADIEGIISHNPQLKKIKLILCPNLDDRIFQSIAEHLPRIEKLHIRHVQPTDGTNAKYLSQLHNLKSLFIRNVFGDEDHAGAGLKIWEIDFANLPLEYLGIQSFHLCVKSDRFILAISQLKNLKYLDIDFMYGLTVSHILDICKQHSELTKLGLVGNTNLVLSVDDLLAIVQNAEKLEYLGYSFERERGQDEENAEEEEEAVGDDEEDSGEEPENVGEENEEPGEEENVRFCIDVEAFKKFVNIVRTRRHKTRLMIWSSIYEEIKVPDNLIKLHAESLEIIIEK